MGVPVFREIKSLTLYNFSTTKYVTVTLSQPTTGTFFYRLKISKGQYGPSDFSTTYFYLGKSSTESNWTYTRTFPVYGNASLSQNYNFETLFTQYPTINLFQLEAKLQCSSLSSFPSSSTYESTSTRLIIIELADNSFGPSLGNPSWVDVNNTGAGCGINALTQSNQKAVQNASRMCFTFPTATARYGTSISKYYFSVKGVISKTFTPAQMISYDSKIYFTLSSYPNLSGTVSVSFSAEDTRGQVTMITRNLEIVPYRGLLLSQNNTHRQNGTGATVILDFSGTWYGSPLSLACTGITAVEKGSSTAYATLIPTVSISGSTYSYNSVWENVAFDPKKAYQITAVFTDGIKTVRLTLPLPAGTPVMSIRDGSISVFGVLNQNSYPVLGFNGVIGGSNIAVDLNNYVDTGYRVYKGGSTNVSNFPSANSDFILKVIGAEGYAVQKVWYFSDSSEYIRTKKNGWSSWKKVTMT